MRLGGLFSQYYTDNHADMAELADALDLGSSGQPCRFKSCYPHFFYGASCRLAERLFLLRYLDELMTS